MKAPTLDELAGVVHPHDLPRTEAALIQRTAQLSAAELEAIVDSLLQQKPHEAVVRLLFRRWAEVALPRATAFLTKLPQRTAVMAGAAIAARLVWKDAAAARAWAASLADMSFPEKGPLEMRPGVPNPLSHAMERHTGGGSPVERTAWQIIINTLSRRSPPQAVEAWRLANDCGVGCRMQVPSLIAAMSEMPEQALAFIQELGDGDLAMEALGTYAQNLAGKSPEQALELISRMEPGRDRDRVINDVLHAAPSLVGRMQKLYSADASDYEFSCMKQALVHLGTREAVRQMVEFPDLIRWIRQGWEVFCDLLDGEGEEPGIRALLSEDLPSAVLSGAASALATSSRETSAREAADLLRRFGAADDYVVSLVAESLAEDQSMDTAAGFILSMPEDQRRFAWSSITLRAATPKHPGGQRTGGPEAG